MKILVLMPLNEREVYNCAVIENALTADSKDNSFFMPMYMDYLVQVKIAKNWVEALFLSIKAAQSIYETADKEGKDLILFGNIDKNYKFDLVYSFMDNEEVLYYEDKGTAEVRKTVMEEMKNDAVLQKCYDSIKNLYDAKDVNMPLTNCDATGDFISAMIKSNVEVEKVLNKYQSVIKEVKRRNLKTKLQENQ